MIQPVVAGTVGAVGGAIPGFQVMTSIMVNSLLSGSANAFLTLRVGIIAKDYCGSLVAEPRTQVQRAATAEAARLLSGIVKDSGNGSATRSGKRSSSSSLVRGRSGRASPRRSELGQPIWAGTTRRDAVLGSTHGHAWLQSVVAEDVLRVRPGCLCGDVRRSRGHAVSREPAIR